MPSVVTHRISDRNAHEHIAKTLARAFQNEDACSYIFPDAEVRAKRLIAMFRVIVANDAPVGSIYQTENGEAITLWRAPGKASGTAWEFAKSLLPFIAALGPGIGRRPMLIICPPILRLRLSVILGFTAT